MKKNDTGLINTIKIVFIKFVHSKFQAYSRGIIYIDTETREYSLLDSAGYPVSRYTEKAIVNNAVLAHDVTFMQKPFSPMAFFTKSSAST